MRSFVRRYDVTALRVPEFLELCPCDQVECDPDGRVYAVYRVDVILDELAGLETFS